MYTKFNRPKSCPRTVYRYGNVDFNCLRNALSYTPWDLVLDSSTTNFQDLVIARNQGHFEPANNYQRYTVLHSGTIEYQEKENSIWRRSRLDLQRRVHRTMTYTIWTPQIFYLMKRKKKEDLQVNLWDFSRQSDNMMSEFWFALI